VPVTTARSDANPSIHATRPRARDARALELPLRCVHVLDGSRLDVDQSDPGVVPRALRWIVCAHRDCFPAGPVDLEDVHAVGAHLPRRPGSGVDEEEPPPVLGGSENLRIGLSRARLGDLGRGLGPRPVGTEIGREDEQRASVGRPADLLDGAGERADLSAAVDPEAHPAGVATVGGEGELRSIGREARRPSVAPASVSGAGSPSTSPSQSPRLEPLALLLRHGATVKATRRPSAESSTSTGR